MLNVKCPICHGKGTVPDKDHKEKMISCSVCAGKGTVNFYAVSEEIREILYRQHAS